MATKRGYPVDVSSDIEMAVKKWRTVVKTWCGKLAWEDVPWWYNERSSVSLLAAAIWRIGGVAIEEYSADKGKKRRIGKGGGIFLFS